MSTRLLAFFSLANVPASTQYSVPVEVTVDASPVVGPVLLVVTAVGAVGVASAGDGGVVVSVEPALVVGGTDAVVGGAATVGVVGGGAPV